MMNEMEIKEIKDMMATVDMKELGKIKNMQEISFDEMELANGGKKYTSEGPKGAELFYLKFRKAIRRAKLQGKTKEQFKKEYGCSGDLAKFVDEYWDLA